ncbi:MAG TPA: ATP-binding protein [Nitrospira sp.]|nr:ATP-binding protein [Nitrospira sp.]
MESVLTTMESSSPDRESHPCASRARYAVLQSLVGIMLAYQLAAGSEAMATPVTTHMIIAGLVAMVGGILIMPHSILQRSWFSGLLVGLDTILVTATIYLSGNARSDLYLSYFILMLIAASVRRFSHVIAFSLLLSAGYGFVLYQAVAQGGAIVAGHLLGVPVLLVMAIFYGLAMETIGTERQQKARLLESIEELKHTERALQDSLGQLQHRIKGLKDDLSKANAHVQQGHVERQGLQRQLVEAQKMETIGRIASGIAGEFSRLCSVIGKQTGVVLSRLKPEDPLYGPVDMIFRSGEQAAVLTAQLAALDIQQREFRHVLPISRIIEELSGVIRDLLPKGIECRITIDPAAPHAEVDREELEQALLNVVVNARDAMSGHGRLSIDVTCGPAKETESFAIAEAGRFVMIQVADTGSGMSRDTQSRMFEPFFSTKETNIGLGLTAVYGIVKRHGGHLEVTSAPAQGTKVRIALPAVEASTSPNGAIGSPLAARGEETVLLVEPHEIERKLALSTLLRHRYRVLEATNPVEALMLVQQHAGSLDVAVSGLIMPDINGRDLAKRLLKKYPTMKALFLSGYDDEAILSHRINRRFLLRRPYRQTGLVEKVRELIDA